ncbi:twitching motility two-component system response regulator PilH/two-component system, OmpR family, phosphate regulon response regulator PhoB/two-component system, OmpR family, alkaline phosphatase synthesis response regulator PhoP [Mucilaginibacter gossypiicola]|uniref:Response regulatory domain-containing protein n=1 Tax=Mucilaginibacter gossypiicola TaxID=551995 RepID=A0A1H8EXV6_9SPHI|nr:response regulator [Mucilaginibacter gossypiicola]SEN24322.1 twitching motility two-component system response regulator PilH/two-component system, OmpR family, phosphate regulon response regulator PhoB/two-component system, OmpR family, alkaline phosphatase synthesis response regulator PhoP [Mucilaginibacter gossypiicola]
MAKRVLIVDDNELMIEVMTYILLGNGYEVAALSRIHEIFKIIKACRPDLVILDIADKSMDGRELCRLIKLNRATKNLRVIVCSENEEMEPLTSQKGAPDDVLHKPFGMNSLIRKVELQLAA